MCKYEERRTDMVGGMECKALRGSSMLARQINQPDDLLIRVHQISIGAAE